MYKHIQILRNYYKKVGLITKQTSWLNSHQKTSPNGI